MAAVVAPSPEPPRTQEARTQETCTQDPYGALRADGPGAIENTARAVDYCLRHPQWRLSLQTHKVTGIP